MSRKLPFITFGAPLFGQEELDEVAQSIESTPQEKTDIQEEQPSSQDVMAPAGLNYIVGCFGNKQNADNLVQDLQNAGLEGRIFDMKNGLHRVTAGSALSQEEIGRVKAKAQSAGFNGWILK